jgi:hypothetical protein
VPVDTTDVIGVDRLRRFSRRRLCYAAAIWRRRPVQSALKLFLVLLSGFFLPVSRLTVVALVHEAPPGLDPAAGTLERTRTRAVYGRDSES